MCIFIEQKLLNILKKLTKNPTKRNTVVETYEYFLMKINGNANNVKHEKSAYQSHCNSRADRRIHYQGTLTGEANFAYPTARSGPYFLKQGSSLVRDNCI